MHIQITDVVMHQIPKPQGRSTATPHIDFSDEPADLDPQTSRFVREELLEKPLDDSRRIAQPEGDESTFLSLVRAAVVADRQGLVERSQEIAQLMFDIQKGNASSGLVMVAKAIADTKPCLIVSKVEHQVGVHLEPKVDAVTGHRTFDVELLRQLVIGRNARVYKIALIWEPAPGVPATGLLVDKQNGKGYAEYFLEEFLGMALAERAEILTKTFVDSIQQVISALDATPEKQGRYEVALLAELASNADVLNPTEFLRHHVDEADVSHFRDALAGLGEDGREFRKDLRLIPGGFDRARVQTAGGATLLIPTEMIDSGQATFTRQDGDAARTKISIEDEIERWSGGTAGRAS